MKRFYDQFTSQYHDGKYYFYYDAKPVKTPLGHFLTTPYGKLADALAVEWNSQGNEIDIKSLKINHFINTIHDVTVLKRVSIIENLQQYAQFDCLFHFTQEENEILFKQQINQWLPLIQKFQEIYNVKLEFDTKLIVDKQSEDYAKIVSDFFNDATNEELTILYKIVTILGSVVLAILAFHRHISFEDALKASRLEQDYNISQWGLDSETEKAKKDVDDDYNQAISILSLMS